jgi:hypothetical protein
VIELRIFLDDRLPEKVQGNSEKVDDIRRRQRTAPLDSNPFSDSPLTLFSLVSSDYSHEGREISQEMMEFSELQCKICTLPDFQEKSIIVS